MHRTMTVAAVVVLIAAACSSAGDDAGGSVVDAVSDPVATFCTDWETFDALTNSDDDPTEQLVREVVDLQDEMEAIVPDGLESQWASILEWNRTFIEYFEATGYGQPSDEVIFDLLGGEEAAVVAGQDREDAYVTIQGWARHNCPGSNDATLCDLWPVYDEFLESDPEPTEELVAQLLEMQDEIDGVLPLELTTFWAGIVDWNQAFIDVFEQVGYGPVTDETFLLAFGGDEAVAGAAGEAMETGLDSIRSWTASNCTDGSEHASTFCTEWAEFAALTANEDAMTSDSYDEALAVIDRVGSEVPAEVSDDWDAVVESARGFYDVLVSVNFEPDRITDELLEQGFGSVEAAIATEEAADAGRATIEEWSLTGCGDFCSRWPEFRQALDETGTHDLGWVVDMGDETGRERLAEHLRLFEIGNRMVPDEIHEPWDLAVAARRDWIAWWEEFDFNGDELHGMESRNDASATRDLAVEMMRDADYLVDDRHADLSLSEALVRTIAAWQNGVDQAPDWLLTSNDLGDHERAEIAAWLDGSGGPPEWLLNYWRMGPTERVGYQITSALDGWTNDNCEAVTGQPGTVKVLFPKVEGAAGDTLVLALMPEGATIGDLTDPSRVLAGTCSEIASDPWGVWRGEDGRQERWASEEFRAERWEGGGWCDYRREEEPARVDAGTYTMLAAVIEGRPDRELLGTPSACLAFDVRVERDTVIDVPTLPSCDVALGGTDDPWRNPAPVDPTTPGAGTLQIVFPDLDSVGQSGEVIVVVLPAGTTLNDVGREQVWPVGATQTWLPDPGARAERGPSAMTVPVAELPAGGSPRALDPNWLAENPPADRLPLVTLAPGAYDVHVQIRLHDPPEADYSESSQNDRCGSFEVTIAGDTVVDLPELGECPRVV